MPDTTASASTPTRPARRLLVPVWGLAIVLLVARLYLPGADGLHARYFEGPADAGRLRQATTDRAQTTETIRTRLDAATATAFTVHWSGSLLVTSPGTFTFGLASTGLSSLAIDGQPVVARPEGSPPDATTGVRRLTSGPHAVAMTFASGGGPFSFDWWWARQGDSPSSVPAWLLSTRPVRAPEAMAARLVRLLVWPVGLLTLALTAVSAAAGLRHWRPRWAVEASGTCTHAPRVFVLHRCVREGVARRLSAWHLPTLPRVVETVLSGVAVVLPLLLVGHALTFWGRGIIDQEAVSFVINYLADRPFLQTIFDPVLNDWGLYQARELAYVFDWVDARIFAWLMVDRQLLLFIPFSSVVSLVAITAIYLTGARKVLRLDWTTALLLYALFLSTIVVQSSTAILYRSSKIVLTALQLLFVFRALALLDERRARVSPFDVVGLSVIGVLMTGVDRQGYAVSLVVTTVAGFLWVRNRWLPQHDVRVPRAYGSVALASAIVAAWAVLYNNLLAPEAIHRLNGYWPDFVFEEIPLVRLDRALVLDTLRMFARQLEYFFGHLPFVGICALALLVWGVVHVHDTDGRASSRGFWGWLTGTGVVLTTAMVGANVILIAVSGMRHPPVFRIADHALWYYLLPFQGSVLFAASLAASRLPQGPTSRWQPYAWVLLVAMVAGNAWHWSAERDFIATSPQYFGKQHEFSRLYGVQYALDAQGADESTRVLPSWMRVRPDAAEVHLPLKDYGFLDAVRASYLTVRQRAPLVDAGGPHWKELREFLDGGASPFLEPAQVTDSLLALQAIGVRRLVIHRDQFDSADSAATMVNAVRQMGDRLQQLREDGRLVVATLTDARFPRVDTGTWAAPIPASALRLSASQSGEQLPGLLDGHRDTEWNSTTRQVGREWIRIDLDRPRDLAGIRLDMTDDALVRYPRHLQIEVTGADGTQMRFDGSVLPAMLRGILMEPKAVPLVLPIAARQVQSVVLKQTGESPSWGWALRELRLYEPSAR